MGTILVLLPGVVAVLAALRLVWAWQKHRGARLVTCPETKQPAGVSLDAKHAAAGALFHAPPLRLEACSRWPERRDCGQECLRQIEIAPAGCLVRNILAQWYQGKQCAICGKAFGEIHWADHKPALLDPNRMTREWAQVPAETLPGVMESHAPVCWNCHITQTFCREHPELVVNRSRPA